MNDRERMYKDAAIILSIIKYVLVLSIIALVIYFGAAIFIILLPFVIGLILARAAYLLAGKWLSLRNKLSHKSSLRYVPGLAPRKSQARTAGIFYIFIVILFLAALAGIITATVFQVRALASYIPGFLNDTAFIDSMIIFIQNWSKRLGGPVDDKLLQMISTALTSLQKQLIEALPGIAAGFLNRLGRILSNLPTIIVAIVVTIMSGYFFAADSRSIYRFLCKNLGIPGFVRKMFDLINALTNTLFRIVGGYLLLLIITFVEAIIGFTIIRMPYALVLAMVAAIVDFLPILGISATMVPVIVYLSVMGNYLGAVGAVIMLILITVVRRFIEPAILGNAMRLHPMATLFSMILGVSTYGLSGIFIGPLILVIAIESANQFGFDEHIRRFLKKVLRHVNTGKTNKVKQNKK